MKCKVMKNNKQGFSLVEIMFVVAIIGLLASLGIPAIMNAMDEAKDRTKRVHIAEVEKAKGMLTLPELVYERGRSVPPGTTFGEGEYTEENLVACIHRISSLGDFEVDGEYLIPGDIDTPAHYTDSRPAWLD